MGRAGTIAKAPVAGLPDVSMSQSGLIVAALIGGFVSWLAISFESTFVFSPLDVV
jgi:hypothetical protein